MQAPVSRHAVNEYAWIVVWRRTGMDTPHEITSFHGSWVLSSWRPSSALALSRESSEVRTRRQ